MAFASRHYSFQGPTQNAMHDAWSQRLVQDTNTMALLTSAESTNKLQAGQGVGQHAAENVEYLDESMHAATTRARAGEGSLPTIGSMDLFGKLQFHRCR